MQPEGIGDQKKEIAVGPDEGTQVVPSEDAFVGIGHETDCSGKGTNAEHRSDDGFTEVRNGVTIARKTLSD